MQRFLKTVGLAVAFAAMAVSSANATTGPAMLQSRSPIGTASNTGAISGNASSYGTHVFSFAGAQVRCVDATYRVTSVTTTGTTFDPSYAGCVLFAGANFPATVHYDGSVHTTGGTFNPSTHQMTGASMTATNILVTTAPAIIVIAQTRPGISEQNITSTGTADTSASPWGSSITANVTGLTYTATAGVGGSCGGIAEHGTGTYTGTVAVRNVWGSL